MGLLHDAGVAAFYMHDVHELNPLLEAMGQRGMPVDQGKRAAAAQELQAEREKVLAALQQVVPAACKPTKVYKRQPTSILLEALHCETIPQLCKVWACSCSSRLRTHTKKALQQSALHQDGCTHTYTRVVEVLPVEVWLYTRPFLPSNKGLLTYIKFKGYRVPTRKDQSTSETKETSNEAALLRLALQHEHDPVFSLVLQYRDLDKQLSTYLGRPHETP